MKNVLATSLLLCLVVCAPRKLINQAEEASTLQQWDHAYQLWEKVLVNQPESTRARIQLDRARLNASLAHLTRAMMLFKSQRLNEAAVEVDLALSYDPYNQKALSLRDRIGEALQALDEKQAKAAVQDTQSTQFPVLSPTTWEPLNLYFPRPVDVREIYAAMGRAYGINILVDTKIRSEKISIDLRGLDFIKSLDTLMILNRHFFKVVDHNTLIILEDNKNNRERYTNQIVKTYYLSNITPNDLKNHLRQMGDIKEFATNDELNAITIKGSPEQIALANHIIQANDKPQPEVIIEVELLEVNKTAMRNVGLAPVSPIDGQSDYSLGVIADPLDRSDDDAASGGIRGFFPHLNSEDFLTLIPAVAIHFLKESGDSRMVANPQLRVSAGKEASILIGQKIPIASTAFTPIGVGTSSANSAVSQLGGQPLTTYNYNDVGTNLRITPRVHHNDEITLELSLEVSTVVSGGLQPILGQRKVETTIRLKNGETNVLAGLLTNDERRSLRGIAGLADIPVLGRLFSNDDKVINQTDIVLTLKPLIVRGHNITDKDRSSYELSALSLSSLYGDLAERQPDTRKQIPILPAPQAEEAELPDDAIPWEESEPEDWRDQAEEPIAQETSMDPMPAEDRDAENAATQAVLAMTPPSLSGRQGDLVTAQMFITNAENLQKGEITMTFDPQLLQVERVDVGSFFGPRHQQPVLTPAWNHEMGRLSLVFFQRDPSMAFSGSGILAHVSFRAMHPGEGQLVFHQINLINAQGEPLAVQGLEAAVEVAP